MTEYDKLRLERQLMTGDDLATLFANVPRRRWWHRLIWWR